MKRAAAPPRARVLCGHVIDAPRWGVLRSFPDGAVVVEGRRIVAVGPREEVRRAWIDAELVPWPDDVRPVILPGLIDVHAHLPQYPAVARVEKSLLPWLQRHVFPLERDFRAGRSALREEADAFFAELAAHGTTTAMLYAAVWGESCHTAFEAAEASGLRVIMGKVMMDVGSYGIGSDQPAERTRRISLAECAWLISQWHGRDEGRLQYAVTPRFAVTCSHRLMLEAAKLARDHGCHVQTHLSENRDEIRTVAALFPKAKHYTGVYHRTGLLGPRSVLAHCLHLSKDEVKMLADSGAAVAHCPTSNFFLHSGLCPVDQLRRAGLRLGLGSDVAGGPEVNLWQVMRSAVETQQARRFQDAAVAPFTPTDAFHLATRGGAEALGRESVVGTLEPGLEADVLVLDLNKVLPYGGRFVPREAALTAEEIIALCVYRASARAVVEVCVRGRRVFPVA